MRETELEMLQREKEAEHFKTWAEQEDNFHLQQAKLRLVYISIYFVSPLAASPFPCHRKSLLSYDCAISLHFKQCRSSFYMHPLRMYSLHICTLYYV